VELKLKNTGATAQTMSLTEYSLWYILAAGDEASLRAGWPEGLNSARAGNDPDRWPEHEFEAEAGRCLWLPPGAPLFLGAGLTLAQLGPPASQFPASQFPAGQFPAGQPPDALTGHHPPAWLPPAAVGPEESVFLQGPPLSVRLITTAHRSDLTASEALTFRWPLAGQGRVLTRSPAPTTRLKPGRAGLLPAALGRYAVDSGGTVSYLLIESR
jgi:hypothetical protein